MKIIKKISKRYRLLRNYFKFGTTTHNLRIESCSYCQLDCVACPSKKDIGRKFIGSGFLKFEDFKKMVDSYPEIKALEISNFGEPLLNPEINDILKYAYENNIFLKASNGSNLNIVDEETLENLCKYRFKTISISIDGASQETYSIYRRKGNFDQVIENIKTINRYKEKYKTSYPELIWNFIVFGHNEHEISKAKDMAKSLNVKFRARLNAYPEYSPVKDEAKAIKEIGYSSIDEYKKQTNTFYYSSLCKQLWHAPQINWDGKLLGCCVNKWKDFGNVFEDGLEKCLKSKNYKLAKKVVQGKALPTKDIPCYGCPNYHQMKDLNSFVKDSPIKDLTIKFIDLPFLKKKSR